MKINEKRIPEILLAIILVVVLLISILLITQNASGKSVSNLPQTTNSENTNSYNTYNYNYYNDRSYPSRTGYVKIYDSRDYDYDDEYLDYISRGKRERVKGLFGNDIDKYSVYVKNTEYKGGYFKVTFYFEDHYGDERSETITRYIPAKDEEVFHYTDIYADRFENYNWNYQVTSYTKI